jgi:hypothetical protein
MKEFSRYTLAYVLWAVSIVLLGGIGLIARDSFVSLLAFLASPLTQNNKSADFYIGLQIRTADTWSFLILGFVVVASIVYIEYFYRSGVAKSRLLVRFLLITAIELAVLGLAHLTNFIIAVSIGATGWLNVYLPVIEIILMGIFIWLYLRLRRVNVPLD